MKKRDIIQLVKESVKENTFYGNREQPSQLSTGTKVVAPAGKDPYTGKNEYPFSARPKRTGTGMMEDEFDYSKFEEVIKASFVYTEQGGRFYSLTLYTSEGQKLKMKYDEANEWVKEQLEYIHKGDLIPRRYNSGLEDLDLIVARLGELNINAKVVKMKNADDTGKLDEEGESWGLEPRQLADSFTFEELEQLYNDKKISKEDLNGAKSYLQSWIDMHPTYLPQRDLTSPKRQKIRDKYLNESPMLRTGIKQDMAPKEMAGRIKSVFDKVNGAQDPVQTPEWHKNRFKNKYGISFPENIKNINKDQALAMNKYANDMKITEADVSGLEKAAIEAEKKAIEMKIKALNDKKTKMATGTDSVVEELGDEESTNGPGYIGDEKLADLMRTSGTANVSLWHIAKLEEAGIINNSNKEIALKAVGHPSTTNEVGGDERDNEYEDDDQGWEGKADAQMKEYIKERGDDNLMEHMDKYRKRSQLMEGAWKDINPMFNSGNTDDEIVQYYVTKGVSPENISKLPTLVAKLRNNWNSIQKIKTDLEILDQEAEGLKQSPQQAVAGMDGGMGDGMEEEKKLSSGLFNETK